MRAIVDFESRSRHDLRKSNPWVYAEDPSTEVMCLGIKVDDEPAKLWAPERWRNLPGIPYITEAEVLAYVAQAETIEAHNAEFETAIWHHICHRRFGWPDLDPDKLRCSAARASMCALPRSLGEAGAALGLNIQKDAAGHALMMKMCKPRRPSKADPREWIEDPESLKQLFAYCIQDVEAEYVLTQHLPELPESELEIWQLDQKINRRGIAVDLASVRRIVDMTERHISTLEQEFAELAGGACGPRQVAALRELLAGAGVQTDDLRSGSVSAILRNKDLDPNVRRMLQIRQSLSKSSVAKYAALQARTSADGRMRSNLLYHGASTGRWAGKGFQPQNLPRAAVSDYEALLGLLERMDP